MEEIGLQFESRQEHVIAAVRRYVSQGGMRLIEECPLRAGMQILRTREASGNAPRTARAEANSRGSWRASHLAALFESYFDYYFQTLQQRSLIVGPTVGHWTAILYDEKAIDCRLLQWMARELNCRAVGYCFAENEEYSYMDLAGGRVVELFSSILTDAGGLNFWSAGKTLPPVQGPWIADGFLKQRYRFIPGFYDRAYVHGEKSTFCCYHYSAFPDYYDAMGNYPLSAFRYFYFSCGSE
jgi:hypothetical protein